MRVKEIKQLFRDGKSSGFSITVEENNGQNGLITDQNAKKYNGRVEQIKVGDDVPVVFESVNKKNGGGTWTSATIPSWEAGKQSAQSSSGSPVYPQATREWKGDDVYSKLINSAFMTAGNVFQTLATTQPTGTPIPTVEELFTKYVDIAISTYERVKK